MRWLLAAALGLSLLSACETSGGPPVGATDAQIDSGHYRITFRGVSGAGGAEIEDRALLHAANLAVMQGYDWFLVTRRTGGYAGPTTPQFSFGVGGTTFGHGSAVSVGGSHTVGGEPSYVADIEVVFGKGEKPSFDAYDARSVVASLGPRLAPPR
jgi:hypothetical protein